MWLLSVVVVLLSSNTHLSAAATGAIFELGFFAPGEFPNYYLGIWFHQTPGREVVWVANRGSPIANARTAKLKISADGNLILLAHSNATIWLWGLASSPTSALTVAVLLDSGNLVLRDKLDPSRVLWQSFDHPAGSWLPTQPLSRNRVTGEIQILTAWRNLEDPAPGLFSHSIDPNGIDQFYMFRNGSEYWSSGIWSGEIYPSGDASLDVLYADTDAELGDPEISDHSELIVLVKIPAGVGLPVLEVASDEAASWYSSPSSEEGEMMLSRKGFPILTA